MFETVGKIGMAVLFGSIILINHLKDRSVKNINKLYETDCKNNKEVKEFLKAQPDPEFYTELKRIPHINSKYNLLMILAFILFIVSILSAGMYDAITGQV